VRSTEHPVAGYTTSTDMTPTDLAANADEHLADSGFGE
jgi:hypothetical protein